MYIWPKQQKSRRRISYAFFLSQATSSVMHFLTYKFYTFSCPTDEFKNSHFSIYNLTFPTKKEEIRAKEENGWPPVDVCGSKIRRRHIDPRRRGTQNVGKTTGFTTTQQLQQFFFVFLNFRVITTTVDLPIAQDHLWFWSDVHCLDRSHTPKKALSGCYDHLQKYNVEVY